MALFNFRWLRNFVRRNTNQIPEHSAQLWKQRLSIFYMLVAWNTFGVIAYMAWTGNADWSKKYKSEEAQHLTPAQQWSRTLGIQDATVVRVSGLNVSKYNISNEADDKT